MPDKATANSRVVAATLRQAVRQGRLRSPSSRNAKQQPVRRVRELLAISETLGAMYLELSLVCESAQFSEGVEQPATVRLLRRERAIEAVLAGEGLPCLQHPRSGVHERALSPGG